MDKQTFKKGSNFVILMTETEMDKRRIYERIN